MTRRKLVALVGAAVLVLIGLVVFTTGLFITHTETGRQYLKGLIVPFVQNKLPNAKLYVGRVSGSLIGDLTIDTIAIRDMRGELFVSTGRVSLQYNWRDIIDNRIYITRLHVEHPYVHIVQHKDYSWNFKQIFASPHKNEPPKPLDKTSRNWGDYIVIDSTTGRDATFLLTLPWSPDDSLKGAVRDSVIRYHLTHPEKAVVKTFDGYGRQYAWRNGSGLISHVRLADPDSDKFGRAFEIARLSVDEYEPTFQFRNVRGDVKHLGDSVWFDIPHFELPASFGHGTGKIWWGSDLPVRLDITVRGDSVALDDVNWAYATLPHTGGGSLDLVIRNDPKNLHVIDYQLHKLDMRSTGSHLTGDMWFGTGAPVLLVRNVDLKADPITFDLIRTLNGKPFPYDWRGDIFGTAKARGGPLTHFVVDDARGRFEDAHVRGAVSRFSGHGELDILYPALTAFHHFDVDATALDLRTIEFLNPAFPRLGGYVSGTATLDSSWLDVRFSNANLAHQDGPGEPSRVTGSGRVTYGPFMIYDLTLDAAPLNATMLARSKTFEGLPVRGLYSGPLRVQGTAPDLQISTTLQGPAAAFSFDGRADIDSIGGYGAHGRGQFSNLDLNALLERDVFPKGLLAGHYDVAVDSIGVTPSSARGTASVTIDPTRLNGVRVHASQAGLRFVGGRIVVDSLYVRTDAFSAQASGAIGLPEGRGDSLRFVIDVDSLGGLRPLVATADSSSRARLLAPDSLSGFLKVTGIARGTLDALNVQGDAFGSRLNYKKERGDSLHASFVLDNVLTRPVGVVRARLDSALLAGIAIDTLRATLTLDDSTHRAFSADAFTRNGAMAIAGRWTQTGTSNDVRLDTLGLAIDDSRWRLAGPARITFDSAATRVDSLLLRNMDSATVSLAANIPAAGPAFAQLRARAIPLKDVGNLTQVNDALSGLADVTVSATGTKLHPIIDAQAGLTSVTWRKLDADRVTLDANYRGTRATAKGAIVRQGQTALKMDASWPYDITLFGLQPRYNDSVAVTFSADTTDLAIIRPFFRNGGVDSLGGKIVGNVTVSGTPAAPAFNGNVAIREGSALVKSAGVFLQGIDGTLNGQINAEGQDSVNIRLDARTSRKDSVQLKGWVANLAQVKNQPARFNLSLFADSLHAFNKRAVADLTISTPETINLKGTLDQPTLTGSISVDHGAIFLADRDLARKLSVETIVANNGPATTSASSIVNKLMTNLQIQGVPVTLGQDVRLKSAEADVGLRGSLSLEKSTGAARAVSSSGQFVPGLTLTGQLFTTSGTYNLNLGLVQREFSVLQGGTVTFDGGPPETPLVDIRAQYNVKQFRDRDLGVIVNLKGRLPNPTIEFSSNAEYAISQSDLISYLITGAPGFDFGSNGQQNNAKQIVASLLSPTISAVTADQLRRVFGSSIDLSVELGTYNVGDQNTNPFAAENIRAYLNTATISGGKEVYKNVYLGLTAGVCALSAGNLANGLGGKADYTFKPQLSFELTYEPSTYTRGSCQQSQQTLSLIPSPSQFSFSLRHTWRF